MIYSFAVSLSPRQWMSCSMSLAVPFTEQRIDGIVFRLFVRRCPYFRAVFEGIPAQDMLYQQDVKTASTLVLGCRS